MLIVDLMCLLYFYFKQKTAYELRISDWSSDVCSSDLHSAARHVERIDLAFDRVALPVGAAVGGEIERAAIARPAQGTAVVIGAESQLARRAAGRGDEKDLLEARLEIALPIGANGEEIGRESCRGRVGL